MATTETPAGSSRTTTRDYSDRHVVPVLVLEVSDERTRSRMREAGFLSIIVHLLMFISILLAPKYIPGRAVKVWTAAELINRNRELTYLEMPPDKQVVSKRPDTDVISDKDRIATRRPTIDRKTLEELRDSALAGRPGPNTPPSPPPAASNPGQSAQATAPALRSSANPPANQTARLETPPLMGRSQSAFGAGALSPGSAIEQASRASAAARAGGIGSMGGGGDYGLSQGSRGSTVQTDAPEILSDTMGVDFGPYLARVLHDVRSNWFNLIPEVARPPLVKKGKVSIEFAILKNGSIAGMRLTGPSGDVSLDRAAWGGITASNPFPPLPPEFGGQYLALRFHFYYNPDRSDLR